MTHKCYLHARRLVYRPYLNSNARTQDHTHFVFFFFNDTATTEIYTLSLHDALPIWPDVYAWGVLLLPKDLKPGERRPERSLGRSEEHTSELQSRPHLVCRLLLEKKKKLKLRYDSQNYNHEQYIISAVSFKCLSAP